MTQANHRARVQLADQLTIARQAVRAAADALADLSDGFHPAYDRDLVTSRLAIDLEVFLGTAGRCLRAVDALAPKPEGT